MVRGWLPTMGSRDHGTARPVSLIDHVYSLERCSISVLTNSIRLLGLNLLFDFPPHQRARSFDHLWHRTSYHWLLSHRQIVTALHDDLKGAETPAARARARTQLTDVIGRYGEALRRELSTWKKLLDKVISVHGLWGLVHRKINRDVILCHNVTNPDPPTTIDSDRINMVYEALTNLGDLYRYRDDLDRVVTVLGVTPRRNHDVNDEQCYRAAARLCPDKGKYLSLQFVLDPTALTSRFRLRQARSGCCTKSQPL